MMKVWTRSNGDSAAVHFTFENGWTMSIRTCNGEDESQCVEIWSWFGQKRGAVIGPITVDRICVFMQEIQSRS